MHFSLINKNFLPPVSGYNLFLSLMAINFFFTLWSWVFCSNVLVFSRDTRYQSKYPISISLSAFELLFSPFSVYLDGTKSEEDIFSQVYEDLRQELAKQKCKYCPE